MTKKFIIDEEGTDLLLPRMLVKELVEVERGSLRVSKLTDTLEVVRDVRCSLRMEKRQNHVRMNSESESEQLSREPWRGKPGWKHTRAGSLRQSESERGEELELSEVQ